MNATAARHLPRVRLAPGQVVVTREPRIVLGPCLAVTMFDRCGGLATISSGSAGRKILFNTVADKMSHKLLSLAAKGRAS